VKAGTLAGRVRGVKAHVKPGQDETGKRDSVEHLLKTAMRANREIAVILILPLSYDRRGSTWVIARLTPAT
jgi:hypothetical protein